MAFAVTFSVGFGFADVGSGVVVRIGVVFWGDGGVVDDVTVVVGDGVFDVDDVAAGVVLVFFVEKVVVDNGFALVPCAIQHQHE